MELELKYNIVEIDLDCIYCYFQTTYARKENFSNLASHYNNNLTVFSNVNNILSSLNVIINSDYKYLYTNFVNIVKSF